MSLDVYRRARAILKAAGPSVALTHLAGLLQVLTILGLLAIVGLLSGLVETRGVAAIPADRPAWLPAWAGEAAGAPGKPAVLLDSGLFPIALKNRESDEWIRRAWGSGLSRLISAFRPLRNNLGALLSLLAAGFVGWVLLTLLTSWRRSLIAGLAETASTSLRRQLHRQVYRLGQSALPNEGMGPLTDLFGRSVDDVQRGLVEEMRHGVRAPALIVGLLLLAAILSWPLTLALVTLGLLAALAIRLLRQGEWRDSEVAQRGATVGLRMLQEDLGLIRTVKVYGTESFENRRFDDHLERYGADQSRAFRSMGIGVWGWLVAGLATVAAVGLLAVAVAYRTPPLLSLAAAVVLLAALASLGRPIRDILAMRRARRQASRSASQIYDFLDRRSELQQTSVAQFLAPIRDRIAFENVSLKTSSGTVLLDEVRVEIPAGSRVAIMGRDDESKQAFVCLIPRLIDPTGGRIRIDGLDLKTVTLESLRAQVATVLQDDMVFSDAVTANIALGDPGFTLPRVIEAAKVAHAHNFIQDLPNSYDTEIGPLGHYLRADEQYRIALARAYLHDPSILIIEEPIGPLDDEIKSMIDDTIQRLSKGRTVLFLAHRLSTIRSCDRVIILQNGRVEAVGTPRELQATSKIFRHLQYVEFNQFATGDIEAGQMSS